MNIRDFSGLSERVRHAAVVLENGEVLWPFETAPDAINELTETGHPVLGLDARERDDLGLVTEVPLYASENGATPDVTRREALLALDGAEAVAGWTAPNILITW